MGLNGQQRLFVAEYLKDFNATRAYIRAGYEAHSAHSAGPRLLENVEVNAAIEEALKRREHRVEVDRDEVLLTLIRSLGQDVAQAYDEHGRPLPIHQIPVEVRKLIHGIEMGDDGRPKKLRFLDKAKSLELALRHKGLLHDKLEVSGKVTLEQLVLESMTKKTGEE